MSDFEFTVDDRYDEALGAEGRWFPVVSPTGKDFGRFKVRVHDEFSEHYKMGIKRLHLKHAARIKSKKMTDEESIKLVLTNLIIVDWELPKRFLPKGKPVPYTPEAGMAFFANTKTDWIVIDLYKHASDLTNFVDEIEPVDDVEEVAGN